MVRWEPGARQRLQTAALDLYVRRGFEQTTAAEIAQSVGLTERTFFRYFADKREVLFDGQDLLQQAFLDGVAGAPANASPLAKIASALETSAAFFPDERRGYSRRRQTVIEAHSALRERELLKMASLVTAIAAALRARGISDPAATLAAETGVAVFKVAFGQWIADEEARPLVEIEHQVMKELAAVASGTPLAGGPARGLEQGRISSGVELPPPLNVARGPRGPRQLDVQGRRPGYPS